ncbi:MAG: sugar phosphate isomerase/epimerase family protein [Candidatus Hodarchaeales archaeon]|jgi:sugar phosphate isomerase/epimerase
MNFKIGGSLQIPLTSIKRDIELEVSNFRSAGYDYAELGLKLPAGSSKVFEDKLETIRNIIPLYSGHLPQIDYKKAEIELCKKYIESFSDQGINLFIIHLFSPNRPTKDNIEFKIRTLLDLADFAKDKDSILALENTEEDLKTLNRVFDRIPKIDFCLDIGHANLVPIGNKSIDLIKQFGKLLKHIHIHDNVGGDSEKHDIHLPIGEGKINFKPIFEKLKEINYSGNITIELYNADFESIKSSIIRLRQLC